MRTYEEYHKILSLWDSGLYNKSEIARHTGMPLTTVHRYIHRYQTVENFENEFNSVPKHPTIDLLKSISQANLELHFHYAYVFGLYLGDGHISKTKSHRAHRIMIFLDKKYPKIIEHCVESLGFVFSKNKIGIVEK
ncbi:MAG: helix-turn-helix domain-containing protein [Anaerolineae bacterium]|nr:helix-turn-helix domain-containing protein [Anaerolineae bacterium]